MNTEPKFKGIPGIKDVNEAHAILAALMWRCDFRVWSAEEPRPAVYQRPGFDHSSIYVYGDYTAAERGKICEAAALTVRQLQTKPLDLYFYGSSLF